MLFGLSYSSCTTGSPKSSEGKSPWIDVVPLISGGMVERLCLAAPHNFNGSRHWALMADATTGLQKRDKCNIHTRYIYETSGNTTPVSDEF